MNKTAFSTLIGFAIVSFFSVFSVSAVASSGTDYWNPKKTYYGVSTRETVSGKCRTRTDIVRYFSNGKDAYLDRPPAGFKHYSAWCWKSNANCEASVIQHGVGAFCKNFGCRRGTLNDRTICDKR